MKIKLDENLPSSLADALAELGHDADTVPQEGLAGRDDGAVFAAAQSEQRFLVTQDLDFSDIRMFAPGSHHGVMLVRLARPGRLALLGRVRMIFETEDAEAWKRCFVVATDAKIRVRRP